LKKSKVKRKQNNYGSNTGVSVRNGTLAIVALLSIYVVIVFTIYALFVLTFFHIPIFGAFFFVPLVLCMAMILFMGHGDEKKHATHKH